MIKLTLIVILIPHVKEICIIIRNRCDIYDKSKTL